MAMELIPGPNLMVVTPPGGDSTNRPASTQFVTNAIATAIASIPAPPAGVSTTQNDFVSGGISAPANQDYRIVEFVPFSMTLTKFVGKCSTGTMTALLAIGTAVAGGTTVTGGTLNVGTTQVSSTPSALNTAALGSSIILTVSSVTSAANFSFMLQFSRSFTTG